MVLWPTGGRRSAGRSDEGSFAAGRGHGSDRCPHGHRTLGIVEQSRTDGRAIRVGSSVSDRTSTRTAPIEEGGSGIRGGVGSETSSIRRRSTFTPICPTRDRVTVLRSAAGGGASRNPRAHSEADCLRGASWDLQWTFIDTRAVRTGSFRSSAPRASVAVRSRWIRSRGEWIPARLFPERGCPRYPGNRRFR
jgi:hypothetical protein